MMDAGFAFEVEERQVQLLGGAGGEQPSNVAQLVITPTVAPPSH